jgi:hypothetical protein
MKKSSFLGMVLVVILLLVMVVPVSAAAPGHGQLIGQGQALPVQVQEEVAVADPLNLKQLIAEAALLMLFCTGFTSLLKNKLNVEGIWLTISCLLFGLAIGVGYRYAITPLTTFTDWFLAALFGLLCGLMATGVYDAYGNKIDDQGAG